MDYFTADKLVPPAKGDLLISEPYLPDPNFERTVILICEHDDENGTLGFVLNRKANDQLSEVVDEVGNYEADLLVGGPVQQDTLHFLHRDKQLEPSSNQVLEHVFWGGNYEELLRLVNTRSIDPNDIRFYIGYSGWSPGQLMDEMKASSWIVFKGVTSEMIFDWDNQDLWKECLKSMGGKYKLISGYPKDPRLN